MIYYKIFPRSLPKIMFAHYFAKKDYRQYYPSSQTGIELCYIKNGYLDVDICGQKIHVPRGSFLVFCRELSPATIVAEQNVIHMHHTCNIDIDYDLTYCTAPEEIINNTEDMLTLPFFFPPSDEIKRLSKKLEQLIIDYNSSDNNSVTCAISFLGLLGELSMLYKSTLYEKNDVSSSILCYRIKKYVSSNITKDIKLGDISEAIGKTPNYLNSVFKRNEKTSIGQYISREKINMLIEIKKTRDITFEDACICVGITDISYGYRLFKKHIGTTPKIYFYNLLKNI